MTEMRDVIGRWLVSIVELWLVSVVEINEAIQYTALFFRIASPPHKKTGINTGA